MSATVLDIGDDVPVGLVYFIANQQARLVKIGFTTHIGKRFADLQTASGAKLSLVRHFRAGRDVEKEIHRFLSSERTVGEWFTLSEKTEDLMDEIADFINSEDDDLDEREHTVTVSDFRKIVSSPSYGKMQ